MHFSKFLDEPSNHFIFLNTISVKNYDALNFNNYTELDIKSKVNIFWEHKERIKTYFKLLFKLVYDEETEIENLNLEKHLGIESNLLLYIDKYNNKSLLGTYFNPIDEEIDANNVLSRILIISEKPKRWLFRGNYSGVFDYQFSQLKPKIIDDSSNSGFDISDISENDFTIKCMKCVKCSMSSGFSNADNLDKNFYYANCSKEV